ncbi:MAG: hypothetical protein FWD62_15085 [Betaproteobacteria bacterium]|nr:hypothetical protein [Betaproteobacteria bacterium]
MAQRKTGLRNALRPVLNDGLSQSVRAEQIKLPAWFPAVMVQVIVTLRFAPPARLGKASSSTPSAYFALAFSRSTSTSRLKLLDIVPI